VFNVIRSLSIGGSKKIEGVIREYNTLSAFVTLNLLISARIDEIEHSLLLGMACFAELSQRMLDGRSQRSISSQGSVSSLVSIVTPVRRSDCCWSDDRLGLRFHESSLNLPHPAEASKFSTSSWFIRFWAIRPEIA
jgi:hypothetical protein